MKLKRTAVVALFVALVGIHSPADAAQSSCTTYTSHSKWCIWTPYSYSGTPYYSSVGSGSLANNVNYHSWWNKPAGDSVGGTNVSLTQKTKSGAFVGCTLVNYGTGSGDRTAAVFNFNVNNSC